MAEIQETTITASIVVNETEIKDICLSIGVYATFSDPILQTEIDAGKDAIALYLKNKISEICYPVVDYKAKVKDAQVREYLNGRVSQIISTSHNTETVTVPD